MRNKIQNSADFGFARVKVYRGTCYGSPALTVEIVFDAAGETSAGFSDGFKTTIAALERAEAESFLSKIFGILNKPEVLSGLHHVDVRYHAEIEWKSLAFIKGAAAATDQLKVFSNEWFVEEIEEFTLETAAPEIAARFQKILDKKPHRHALEIYAAVKDFRAKIFCINI